MIVVTIVALAVIVGWILLVHGAATNRPDWYQQELDDEQMRVLSGKNMKKQGNSLLVKIQSKQKNRRYARDNVSGKLIINYK